MSARARDDGQSGAVAHRAHAVPAEYRTHAQRLDARADVQAFNAGATDAVQSLLQVLGPVRPLVVGQYGEASLAVHELLELIADSAASEAWRTMGARSRGEARAYFVASLRRSWGCLFVREMARHRLRRVCYVGAGHRPRATHAYHDERAGQRGAGVDGRGSWSMDQAAEFHAYEVRRAGAFAGISARRGAPVR